MLTSPVKSVPPATGRSEKGEELAHRAFRVGANLFGGGADEAAREDAAGNREMSLRSSASSALTEILVVSAISRSAMPRLFAEPLHPPRRNRSTGRLNGPRP